MTEPEQWAVELAAKVIPAWWRDEGNYAEGYDSNDAAMLIQRAFEERERTGQLVPAQPSGDEVEAVARAICNAIVEQDDPGFQVSQDWEGTVSYLDQGETNFLVVATAAIAALDAIRGRQ